MITLTVILQNSGTEDIEKVVNMANDGKWCAEKAMFSVDGISFFPSYDIENRPFVFAVNNSRTSNKIIYRMDDNTIIESSMSDYSYKKFLNGLSGNKDRLASETREVLLSA